MSKGLKVTITQNLTVSFGKYKGQLWTRVPMAYLRWLINQPVRTAESEFELEQAKKRQLIAKLELKRRGVSMLNINIDVSDHAIDRASLKCLNIYQASAKPDEGIATWTKRIGSEALAHGVRVGRYIHYNGMKLVINQMEVYPVVVTVMKE